MAAVALIIERIIAGDSNYEINYRLVTARHLPKGERLSRQALGVYRRSDAVKTEANRLTEEAIQVGHDALSEAIVTASRILRAAIADLLGENGRWKPRLKLPDRIFALRAINSASNFLWDRLGWDNVLDAIAAAEREEHDRIDRETTDQAKKDELHLLCRNAFKQILAEMLQRKRDAAGVASAARRYTDPGTNESGDIPDSELPIGRSVDSVGGSAVSTEDAS